MNSGMLQLLADYHQVHLFDEGSDTDLGDSWTSQAVLDRLAVGEDAMAVGTTVNVSVAVAVELLAEAPADDSAEFDHVAEGSIQVPSGRVVVMGCTDYEPDAARFAVTKGPVRVRAASSNLAEAERLDIDSDEDPATMERLRLQIWTAPLTGPVVIKRWET